MRYKNYFRSAFILFLIFLMFLVYFFWLSQYLTFEELSQRHKLLIDWVSQHYGLMVVVYLSLFIILVGLSFPISIFFMVMGGFLFDWWGLIYTLIGLTVGSLLLLYTAKITLGDWLKPKAENFSSKMGEKFKENAFQYLLFIRIVPGIPFWVVNLLTALFKVNVFIVMITTFLGMMPKAIIYVMLGNGLGDILEMDETPDLSIILRLEILIPLIGLACLAVIPIIYKAIKARK